jgi:hypothetical protein
VELEHGVFAVSDGMGGLDAGEVASGLAVGAVKAAAPKLAWRAASLPEHAAPASSSPSRTSWRPSRSGPTTPSSRRPPPAAGGWARP